MDAPTQNHASQDTQAHATLPTDTVATMDDLTVAAHDADAQVLPLSTIHKRDNHNPRRIRSKKERAELKADIAAKGVMQSVLVRPHPEHLGDYELVAGETRYDLSLELGLTTIPAVIRNLNDNEMLTYAMSENLRRTAMNPIDEGLAAQSLLADGKDKDEVCRELGWKPAFLEGRIQLTHCCDAVAQALCDETISIGHAQLLSGLRPKSQESALQVVLQNNLNVEALRNTIAGLSLNLSVACFDTTDCQTCPHNSSTQATLFADSKALAKARCLNKACYDEKTEAHLTATRDDLTESYHRVELTRDVASGTTTVIVSDGPYGVGQEQATACEGCKNFGATIDSTIGNKALVTKNVCFNLKCHGQKVAEHKAIIATDATAPADHASETKVDQTASVKDTATANAQETDKPAPQSVTPSKKPAEKKPTVAKSAIPAKVVTQHHKIHRQAAACLVNEDVKAAQIIAILSMIAESGQTPDKTPDQWPSMLSGKDRAKAAKLLDGLTVEQLTKLQCHIAAKVVAHAATQFGENETDSFGSLALWVAQSRKADLTKHFTADAEYFDQFTKPMMATRLKAAGFDAHYEKLNGEKSFAKLIGGKKGDIIAAIKASEFDFAGYLPEGLALPDSDNAK